MVAVENGHGLVVSLLLSQIDVDVNVADQVGYSLYKEASLKLWGSFISHSFYFCFRLSSFSVEWLHSINMGIHKWRPRSGALAVGTS
jgi:hypothetical protein